MDDSSTVALEQLAEGVYVWIQPGGATGVSNAGVIADSDGLTIVDTLMVRSQWEPFARAVAELDLPVKRIILTHAHIDHVGGTRAFPHAAIYATPDTSELLDQTMPIDAYKAFMPEFEIEFDDLFEIGTRSVTHTIEDAAQLTPRIEVLSASGHTAGDLMVLVADANILFAGDLGFFGVAPLAFQGDPASWAVMLGVVSELADIIVPGHGPVGGEKEVRELQDYLNHCVAGAIPSGPWDNWAERVPRDEINIERAALLRAGKDEMPPTMLRAISGTESK